FSSECTKTARLLIREDHLPEAYFLLEKNKGRFSTSQEFQMLYASTAINLGEYSSALRALKQYIENNNEDALAHIYLAKAYLSQGEYKEALRAINRGYMLDPKLSWKGVILELKGGLSRLLNLNYYRDSYNEKLLAAFNSIANRLLNLEQAVGKKSTEKFVENFTSILLELHAIKENVEDNIKEIRRLEDRWSASGVNSYIEENLKLIEKKLSKGLTFDAAHFVERLNEIIDLLMERNEGELEELVKEKYTIIERLFSYGVIPEELHSNFRGIYERESNPEKYYLFFDLYFYFLDNFKKNFNENLESFVKELESELRKMEENDFPVSFLIVDLGNALKESSIEKRIESVLSVKDRVDELNRTFWLKEGDYLAKEIEVKLTVLERMGYDTSDYREEMKKVAVLRRGKNPKKYFSKINELFNEVETIVKEERRRNAFSYLYSAFVLKTVSAIAESFAPERYYFKSVLDIMEKFISRNSYERVPGLYSQIIKEFLERITQNEDEETKRLFEESLALITKELKQNKERYLVYEKFSLLSAKAKGHYQDSYAYYMEVLPELTGLLLTYEDSLSDALKDINKRILEEIRTVEEVCPDVRESAGIMLERKRTTMEAEHSDVFDLFWNLTLKKIYLKQGVKCLKKYTENIERKVRGRIQDILRLSGDPNYLIDLQSKNARAFSLLRSGDLSEAVSLYREAEMEAEELFRKVFEKHRKRLLKEMQELLDELIAVQNPPIKFVRYVDLLKTPINELDDSAIREIMEGGEEAKRELFSVLMEERVNLSGKIKEVVENCRELAEKWDKGAGVIKKLNGIMKKLEDRERNLTDLKKLYDETYSLYLKVFYNTRYRQLKERTLKLSTTLMKDGVIGEERVEAVQKVARRGDVAYKKGDINELTKCEEELEELLRQLLLTQNMYMVERIYGKIENLYDLITIYFRNMKEDPWRGFRAEFLRTLEQVEGEVRGETLSLKEGRLREIEEKLAEMNSQLILLDSSWDTYRRLKDMGGKEAEKLTDEIKNKILERDFQGLENTLKRAKKLEKPKIAPLAEPADKETAVEGKEKKTVKRPSGFRGISKIASEAFQKAQIIEKPVLKNPQGVGSLLGERRSERKGAKIPTQSPEDETEKNQEEEEEYILGYIDNREFRIREYSWTHLLPNLLDRINKGDKLDVKTSQEFIQQATEMMKDSMDLPEKSSIERKLQKATYYLKQGDYLRAQFLLRSTSKTLYNYIYLAQHLKNTLISLATILDGRKDMGQDISGTLSTFYSCLDLYNNGHLMRCAEKIRKLKAAISKI
ncbi:MAG: tetratricopeptide repeat protein, partial [Thermoplasmata archaeon]|nr:tetratricopeptide repeat protein [Thermoplasmata archaeon]